MIPTLQQGQFGRTQTQPFLLDVYTGAVAAYSIARRLKTTATGAFRLVRSSDSVEQDFVVIGALTDIPGAQTFIGANTGTVKTLYDQAGSNHISSSGTLPTLISSGTLQTLNGIPQVVFVANSALASAAGFGTAVGLGGNPAFSIFIVHRKTTNTGGCVTGWGDTAVALKASGLYDDGTAGLFAFAGGNSYVTSVPTNNTQYITSVIKTAGAINTTTNVYRNGSSVDTSGHSTNTPNIDGSKALSLGKWANYGSNTFIGGVQELIIYASDQSANRAAIEANIRAFYGF